MDGRPASRRDGGGDDLGDRSGNLSDRGDIRGLEQGRQTSSHSVPQVRIEEGVRIAPSLLRQNAKSPSPFDIAASTRRPTPDTPSGRYCSALGCIAPHISPSIRPWCNDTGR